MTIITNTQALALLMDQVAKDSFVTIDTEFMRERTYWPDLCLIQIAGADHNGIIDPRAEGIDLEPFFELMRNQRILKVFHAARQDIEILVHQAGIVPTPLFDTQIAAMVCGFGDQVSYESIVRKLAHVQIDKSSRFTDWSRRPLSEKQLSYALSDVVHLRTVYEGLRAELARTGREPWIEEEMAVLSNPATYRTDPQDAWKRIKIRFKSKKQLGVLIELAAWRELRARDKNVPRSRIMKDDVLSEIALHMPQNREALENMRALPRTYASSPMSDTILSIVEQGLSCDPKNLPSLEVNHVKLTDQTQAAAEVLKLALKIVSETHGIAPKLIAAATEVEALAINDEIDSPLLKGWRRELFGQRALDLKAGRIVIGFRRGKVALWPEEKTNQGQTDS